MAMKEIEVNEASQGKILALAKGILAKRSADTQLTTKMRIIDEAYARYVGADAIGDGSGKDDAGNTCCGNALNDDNVIAPIVVSQVDSMVAYLADIFLSGTPLFPVVSSPNKRMAAEQLETLLDDHAQLGGYVRQLLLMLRDGVKYNLSAIEVDWTSIEQFTVLTDYLSDEGRKLDKNPKSYNKIKRLDPYNIVMDMNVPIGDIATDGDYAGYIEIISKTKLKRLINKLAKEEKALNKVSAFKALDKNVGANMSNYREHPTVSKYITPNRTAGNGVNWSTYLGVDTSGIPRQASNLYDGSSYEKFTLYARIMPFDLGIKAPAQNTPQIWKFTIINGTTVIEATRIISAFDTLPILFGQPMEDGLGYQTQSIAEGSIPFQDAANTLYNIRFAAARRSVSDRALYNADLINPSDVNNKAPAAKIPVRIKALSNMGIESAYKQIPFDMRGTESTLTDAAQIVAFSQTLSGINGPQQGQFQKGNKSVTEWNDTIGGSDNRMRLPAMMYECQVFSPLKQIMALNIFQYGQNALVVSQKTGEVMDINIDELRKEVLSFRMADGYSPKSKLASSDMLMNGMNLIMNSPMLQQAYGAMLPNLFAHLMQLGGVKGLEQYSQPQAQSQSALNTNSIQAPAQPAPTGQPTGIDPTTGQPASSTAPALPMA